MKKITRISITLPTTLYSDLNEALKNMGYPNRSKAIQDAITALLAEYRWLKEREGKKTGVIVTVYDHDKPGVNKTINDIQHHYREQIVSSTHVHLDEHNCLETITVKGEAQRLRKLIEELKTKKGVKEAKLVTLLS